MTVTIGQKTNTSLRNHGSEMRDIAIVGFSCRFGGDATNSSQFWEMLCNSQGIRTPELLDLRPTEMISQRHIRRPVVLTMTAAFLGTAHTPGTICDKMFIRLMRASSISRGKRLKQQIHLNGCEHWVSIWC